MSHNLKQVQCFHAQKLKKIVPLHRIYLPFISQMEDCCFLYISINIYSVDIIVSNEIYYCPCLASFLVSNLKGWCFFSGFDRLLMANANMQLYRQTTFLIQLTICKNVGKFKYPNMFLNFCCHVFCIYWKSLDTKSINSFRRVC